MRRVQFALLVLACGLGLAGCRYPPVRGRVLALGLAVFSKTPDGRQVPGAATAGFLAADGKTWRHGTLTDPESNVFHKLLEYCPQPAECGLLSAAGSAAALKLWRPGTEPQVLWKADFGGAFSRMRDAEVADVLGDGVPTVVVGTHDQGVVALVRPDGRGGFAVQELDRRAATFVHEIETGDLDGDGRDELYVASDEQREVRRYTWRASGWRKDVLYRYEGRMPGFTWSLTAVDASLVPASAWE